MKTFKRKYIVAFDTMCTGWDCIRDENNNPVLYNSEKEAEEDKFDEDDFVIPATEFIEGRKAIFTGEGIKIIGKLLDPELFR